jgi:hypothetical protein
VIQALLKKVVQLRQRAGKEKKLTDLDGISIFLLAVLLC